MAYSNPSRIRKRGSETFSCCSIINRDMLYFTIFSTVWRILHIRREKFFLKRLLKNKRLKLFFLGQLFLYAVPLKSSGIVESAKLFQLYSLFFMRFREFAKSVLSWSDNTPKVIKRLTRIRQKFLK